MDIFKFKPLGSRNIEPYGNTKFGIKWPKPRSGHRIVTDSTNIYSFGGYNPDTETEDEILEPGPLFRELWKFNLVSRTWIKLKTRGFMPEEVVSHSAVLMGNKLLVFGGTGFPFAETGSNSLHICDLNSLRWNEMLTTGLPPDEQYGQAIALNEGYLYVIGGTDGFIYSMDVHRLHLETRVWEELKTSTKPQARYRHEIAIADGKIYVFGGGTALHSYGFKKVPVFDIEKQMWVQQRTYPDINTDNEPYPLKRRCHSCVQNNLDVYICGGHDGARVFQDIWKIHLPSMRWSLFKENLPCPLYFHSTALASSGEMFVFGGVTTIGQENNSRTNDLYSVCLLVPSLQDMAWSAVQHYVNLSQHSRESLLELGVPKLLLNTVEFYKDYMDIS